MKTLISTLISVFRAAGQSRASLTIENLALRQQLAVYQRNQKHPPIRTGDRVLWVLLRRLWSGWERSLLIVRPETAIAWHRRGFKLIWRCRFRSARPTRIPTLSDL